MATPGHKTNWVTLSSRFPATLNTETDILDLKDGQTPDAWNQDLDNPGRLALGSQAAGTARIADTSTIGATVYNWYFRRLWDASGTNLFYGGEEYYDVFLRRGLGVVGFDEDAQNIVAFFPFAAGMFVGKSTGGYALDIRSFKHGNIEQQMAVDVATHATELDGVAYSSNTAGLYAWTGRAVSELTAPARDAATHFASRILTIDYDKKRLIGADNADSTSVQFVYDAQTQGLFRFEDTGFRWTSRALHKQDLTPFVVKDIRIIYENTDEKRAQIKYQLRRDKTDWDREERWALPYATGTRLFARTQPPTSIAGGLFQMRITDISNNIRIRSIELRTDTASGRDTWSE
jgi:hypothetical protein